jgi:hypothetical protein
MFHGVFWQRERKDHIVPLLPHCQICYRGGNLGLALDRFARRSATDEPN